MHLEEAERISIHRNPKENTMKKFAPVSNSKSFFPGSAFARIFEERTCPSILVLQKGGIDAKNHLRSCIRCRTKMNLVTDLNGGLTKAGELLAKAYPIKRNNTFPQPGDIRRIRPSVSPEMWFDHRGRYHNPPLVAVLSYPDEMGLVWVAQCFDEPDLCDLGDVPVAFDGMMFAEAWNTYTVPVELLSRHRFARMDDISRIEQILEMRDFEYPSIDPRTPLFHFRSLEAETGSFFTMFELFAKFS